MKRPSSKRPTAVRSRSSSTRYASLLSYRSVGALTKFSAQMNTVTDTFVEIIGKVTGTDSVSELSRYAPSLHTLRNV